MLSSSAFAGPAIVVMIDDACGWGDDNYTAMGDVHFVLNDGLQWVLSCKGEIIEGDSLKKAMVLRSSDDEPVGPCYTPSGFTMNWQMVFTPSGKSQMTCWGLVD
jgi:hypothetical protein